MDDVGCSGQGSFDGEDTPSADDKMLKSDDQEDCPQEDRPLYSSTPPPPAPIQTRPKIYEWWDWIRQRDWTMRTFFFMFGRFIGSWPYACLLTFIILSAQSALLFKMDLRDRVRDGYTPKDSRAYEESRRLREFSGLQGDPMMTTVILRARDNSSMLDPDNLLESVRILQHLKNNLSVPLEKGNKDGEQRRYKDFCGHHCQQNDVVDYFALEMIKLRRGDFLPIVAGTVLDYPIAKIMGLEVHLERNFYGVKVDNTMGNRTNMAYCQVIVFAFTADISKPSDEEVVARWELAVFDYASNRGNEQPVEMLVIGAEIVDLEMNKDSQKMTPYFVAGFVGVFVFICISAWYSLFIYSRLDFKNNSTWTIVSYLLFPICVLAVPGCAITTTFGIYGLLGLRCNSLMMIMPFLIMGIGVNDSFLVVHHWLRESPTKSRAEVMGRVFEEVGPSITMTTLTNVISFSIGALMPTEEIALFCGGSAIAMGFAYLYTLLFFGSILALHLDPRGGTPAKKGRLQKMFLGCAERLLHIYTKLLQNNIMRITFLLIWLGYLAGGISGTWNINSKLETEKILPKDTPIRAPNQIIESLVWTEYYPVIVLVHDPLDYKNETKMQRFFQMVESFENITGCSGANGTLLWLREYQKYFDFVAGGASADFFDESDESSENSRTTIVPGKYDYSQLKGFMESPVTKHFKGMVNLNYSLTPPVRKFSFVVAYQNHTSWDNRIQLQQEWRAITDHYMSDFNATIWNVNGMFVDQMLSLKSVAVQTILWTLVCMFIVCICFIQKLVAVGVATASIGSIAIGTIGYLGIWELDLDPVTICAILISIGMSVDFTAHISMYFMNCPRRNGLAPTTKERLNHAVGSVFWPAVQGNASTLICVLPLVAMRNYIPLVFVKTLTLVVILGTAHGLLLIPMFLSVLPESMIAFDLLTKNGRQGISTVAADRELVELRPGVATLAENDTLLEKGESAVEAIPN